MFVYFAVCHNEYNVISILIIQQLIKKALDPAHPIVLHFIIIIINTFFKLLTN